LEEFMAQEQSDRQLLDRNAKRVESCPRDSQTSKAQTYTAANTASWEDSDDREPERWDGLS
jgi:hypothetical protein